MTDNAKLLCDIAHHIYKDVPHPQMVCEVTGALFTSLPPEERAKTLAEVAHALGITMQFAAGEAAAQLASEIVDCTCGWRGRESDLRKGKCPRCGE